jgi:hypothetical protein
VILVFVPALYSQTAQTGAPREGEMLKATAEIRAHVLNPEDLAAGMADELCAIAPNTRLEVALVRTGKQTWYKLLMEKDPVWVSENDLLGRFAVTVSLEDIRETERKAAQRLAEEAREKERQAQEDREVLRLAAEKEKEEARKQLEGDKKAWLKHVEYYRTKYQVRGGIDENPSSFAGTVFQIVSENAFILSGETLIMVVGYDTSKLYDDKHVIAEGPFVGTTSYQFQSGAKKTIRMMFARDVREPKKPRPAVKGVVGGGFRVPSVSETAR